MTSGGAEISLRGDGAWGGFGDSSTMSPTPGTFSALSGCYITKDGTEIRRMPGKRLAGVPYCGEPIPIAGTTQGTPTRLLLNPEYVNNDPKASSSGYCYIHGHNEIPDDEYTYTKVSANEIDVDVTTTVAGASGQVLFNRLRRVHNLAQAEGRTAVICETEVDGWTEVPSTRYNIGTVMSPGPLDLDNPKYPGDTDDDFLMWPSPTMIDPGQLHWDNWGGFTPPGGRMQADALNGIIVIAVPFHGCLYQNNVRAVERFESAWTGMAGQEIGASRYTKLLGIPKGLLFSTPVTPSAGSSGLVAGEVVKVAVGYFDWVTGDVGLPSEVFEYTVLNDGDDLLVTFYGPRKVAPESVGLGTIVYASEPDGEALFPVYTGEGTIARLDEIDGVNGVTINFRPDSTNPTYPRRFPVTEQMPTGASLITVSKGRVFYAAPTPDYYSIRVTPQNASQPYKLIIHGDDTQAIALNNTFSPLVYGRIPHSFAGHELWRDDGVSFQFGSITKGNIITGIADYDHGVEIDFDPGINQDPALNETTDFLLKTQTDLIGYTEEGVPGVSPGLYNMEVDAILGTKPTGLHRMGDALLAMTQRSTVLFTWSSIPRKASSQTVSETVGCISGTSIVEYPGGVAWLSHEGPVAFAGGLQHIGKHVSEFFRTLADDLDGMMPAVTAAVDTERELVVWNLRTTSPAYHYETAEIQLIWSYATGQFSTSDLTPAFAHPAIGTTIYSDGEWKPTEVTVNDADVSRDLALWGWDENAAAYAADVVESIATEDRGPDSNFDSTGIEANVTNSEYGFVRSSNGEVIKWFGSIASVSTNSAELANADGADWKASDVLVTKVIPMRMETHYFKPAGLGFDQEIRGFVVRATVTAIHAYIRFRVEDEDGNVTVHSRGQWGERFRTGTTRFEGGYARGSNLRILIDVVSDGQVAIKDLGVEVTGSGSE